jgi:5-carboxymethyl-2-hydroxymuconate isomerase
LSDGHKCMQMAQAYALTEQTIFSIGDVKNRAMRVTS